MSLGAGWYLGSGSSFCFGFFDWECGWLMEFENLLEVASREELREWLVANCSEVSCCWVPISISPRDGVLLYLDAVEEALCFGWIDGVKKKQGERLVQRLSPRRKKSNWTELNKERVRRLERLGLMTDCGRDVLPDMNEASFVVDPEIEEQLRLDVKVYENFMSFPELYRRIRVDTIWQVRGQREVYENRIEKLIENTRLGKMYGAWNDGGRLG